MTFTEYYHKLINSILDTGVWRDDPNRKGHKRKQIPFTEITHNLKNGFPAITTKPLYWKGVVVELLWFLKGDTNIKYLLDNNVHIWSKDAQNYCKKQIGKKFPEFGDLGKVYGAQWRGFSKEKKTKGVDQITNLIHTLRTNPLSSSMIVNSWNPAELNQMALPPCHYSFQVSCEPFNPIEYDSVGFVDKGTVKYYLDLQFNMRSSDVMLGLPFNMASYALLAEILAKMCNMVPRYVKYNGQNIHLYDNQIKSAKEQLKRNNCSDIPQRFYSEPVLKLPELPNIVWSTGSIDDLLKAVTPANFKLVGYRHHPTLNNKLEMLSYNK